mgnify:CR=1 FL=1|tara:strand:+ start:100 stop:867 length:768 start_codon:yes stop_codon:yes gene_type:complete
MNLIKSGDITDDVFEQLADALERITAKVLAGIFVSQKAQVSILYDTKEYTPFISSTLRNGIENVEFDYSKDDSFFTLMMNSLTKWETPTIRDKVHFFNVIEETCDFEKLKIAMKQVEDFFKDMIITNPEIVTKKLKVEFDKLEKVYQDEVKNVMERLNEKASWHIIDMITGQFIGFLSPWIEDAKKLREEEISNLVKSQIIDGNNLSSQLFYISELWKKVVPETLVAKMNLLKRPTKKEMIWGEDKNYLPWYEKK